MRPNTIQCPTCGVTVHVQEKGAVPKRCKPCAKKHRSNQIATRYRVLRRFEKHSDHSGVLTAVEDLATAYDNNDWEQVALEVPRVVATYRAKS